MIARHRQVLPRPRRARSPKIKYPAIPPEPARTDGFAVGVKIAHPMFGFGHITHLDGERVTIMFDKSGLKKIAAGFITVADA
jgi:DNA helicase-2/ATP-dependent DNA helicase PcrA